MNLSSTKFFLAIFLLQANQAFAIPEITHTTNNIKNIDITGPADQIPYASIIGNSGTNNGNSICNNSSINYTLGRIEYQPIGQWTGETYQATTAHRVVYLFETGISGFSFAPMGGLSYTADNFIPLTNENKVIWKGSLSNSSRISSPIQVTIGVYIYKGSQRIIGSKTLPGQIMYRYACYDNVGNGNLQEVAYVQYPSVSITGSVTGCTPITKVASIEMDKIPAKSIETADASVNIGQKKQSFSLQCDPDIQLFVSVVDLSDTTNQSMVSTLTADSSASGVGFAVTNPNGQRLQFGPDGSAKDIPGQRKYYIQRTGTDLKNNPVNFSLGFSYVRKPEEEFKTGTAKAMIGLTYSYQ